MGSLQEGDKQEKHTKAHNDTTDPQQDRKSGSAGMPRPNSYAVFCVKKKSSGVRYLAVLMTLASFAGTTEMIRLGVYVLVDPCRPAVLSTEQRATIQQLFFERMIACVC